MYPEKKNINPKGPPGRQCLKSTFVSTQASTLLTFAVGGYVSTYDCRRKLNVTVDCSVGFSSIESENFIGAHRYGEVPADPDVAGIGVSGDSRGQIPPFRFCYSSLPDYLHVRRRDLSRLAFELPRPSLEVL